MHGKGLTQQLRMSKPFSCSHGVGNAARSVIETADINLCVCERHQDLHL
jgi:hypothetical protein